MALITYPDKVENDTWSPAEVNEVKNVVNGKEDLENKATDFSVKNNVKYPTTLAVSNEYPIGKLVMFKGTVLGSEDLGTSTYKTPGFWSPTNTFNATHASWPFSGTKKSYLQVLAQNESAVQIVWVLAANDDSYSELWFRTFDPNVGVSGEWGKWTQAATYDKMVTSLASPDNNTWPTTLAVANALPTNISTNLGELAGDEDLGDKKTTGFWVASSEFSMTDASYPTSQKGFLIIHANENYILQQYVVIGTTSGQLITRYERSGTDAGVWSSWMKVDGTTSGTPTVTTSAGAYGATMGTGSRDHAGKITVTKSAGEAVATLKVTLTFDKPSTDYISANVTPGTTVNYDGKIWIDGLTSTQLSFFIDGTISDTAHVDIYYSAHKK